MSHYDDWQSEQRHYKELHHQAENTFLEIYYDQTRIKADHYQQMLIDEKKKAGIALAGKIVYNGLIAIIVGPPILGIVCALSPLLIFLGILLLLNAWSQYGNSGAITSVNYGLVLLIAGLVTLPVFIWMTQNQ